MTERNRVVKIVLCVLIAATLAFIFVNSCLPREVSSAESEAVGGFISLIFPEGTLMNDLLAGNVRKIAHFSEFGALGAELVLYILLFSNDVKRALILHLTAPFVIGLVDETIQIFSDRGPQISDVWIDAAGCFCFALLTLGIYYAVRGIRERRVLKQNEK